MKQCYVEMNFRQDSLAMIDTINAILDDYVSQKYVVTVRQLYYQLVSQAVIPNTERSYKKITSLVNDGRMAGLIDWDAIEDRTRSFIRNTHWDNAGQILRGAAYGFYMDMWKDQECRLFCIVEKEALAGVLERSCKQYDIPLLAARGYPSGTVLRDFVESDLSNHSRQQIIILHLGDHDPSGIDMSRDLEQRIRLFGEEYDLNIYFNRIALNMHQIHEQAPPPNPAKTTDARFVEYRRRFGDESWELDALKPTYLNALIKENVDRYVDFDLWGTRAKEIEDTKAELLKIASDFDR
jgi:hypothetical protein